MVLSNWLFIVIIICMILSVLFLFLALEENKRNKTQSYKKETKTTKPIITYKDLQDWILTWAYIEDVIILRQKKTDNIFIGLKLNKDYPKQEIKTIHILTKELNANYHPSNFIVYNIEDKEVINYLNRLYNKPHILVDFKESQKRAKNTVQ